MTLEGDQPLATLPSFDETSDETSDDNNIAHNVEHQIEGNAIEIRVDNWIRKFDEVVYPDSDGAPLSDNTLQLEWIIFLKKGFDLYFRDRSDVFVAGDLLWYPVEGDTGTNLFHRPPHLGRGGNSICN